MLEAPMKLLVNVPVRPFTVLSRFRPQKFISFATHMLRSRTSDSVYYIIQSDIHKD